MHNDEDLYRKVRTSLLMLGQTFTRMADLFAVVPPEQPPVVNAADLVAPEMAVHAPSTVPCDAPVETNEMGAVVYSSEFPPASSIGKDWTVPQRGWNQCVKCRTINNPTKRGTFGCEGCALPIEGPPFPAAFAPDGFTDPNNPLDLHDVPTSETPAIDSAPEPPSGKRRKRSPEPLRTAAEWASDASTFNSYIAQAKRDWEHPLYPMEPHVIENKRVLFVDAMRTNPDKQSRWGKRFAAFASGHAIT